jgi:CBS domain-containing protein
MYVRDVLDAKSREVVRVGPDQTVAMAARLIANKEKGLAVVCDTNHALLGIISVIDINRAVAVHIERASALQVRKVMNPTVVTCRPDDRVEDALDKMATNHIRHLPVVENGVLLGVVNIRDLLESRSEEEKFTAEELRRYIFGAGYH